MITALKTVLSPFYQATKLLSGSKYPTLSISFVVSRGLKNFLTTTKDDQPLENSMKKLYPSCFYYEVTVYYSSVYKKSKVNQNYQH